MPTTVESKPLTIQQRGAEATRRLRAALGLGDLTPAALKLLSTAVAQAAADEAESNPAFARRLQATHEGLLREALTPRRARRQPERVDLVPIAAVDTSSYDPYGPPDPYFLVRLYGIHQLPAALGRYNLPRLKQALAVVEERNPGSKPTNRSKKDAIVEYIVKHVTT